MRGGAFSGEGGESRIVSEVGTFLAKGFRLLKDLGSCRCIPACTEPVVPGNINQLGSPCRIMRSPPQGHFPAEVNHWVSLGLTQWLSQREAYC